MVGDGNLSFKDSNLTNTLHKNSIFPFPLSSGAERSRRFAHTKDRQMV